MTIEFPLPIPSFVDLRPEVVDRLKSGRHAAVEAAALDFARQHPELVRPPQFKEAGRPKILPVLIDLSGCFVMTPEGQDSVVGQCMSVPGAIPDLIRTVQLLYQYAPCFWQVLATVDSHPAHTVHSRLSYLDASTGEPPAPFTPISIEALELGTIVPIKECFEGLRHPLEVARELWHHYGPESSRPRMWNAMIMAWATHGQEGSVDQALMTELWQAIHYWEVLMRRNAVVKRKGLLVDTESYGAFQSAVPTSDPRSGFDWETFKLFLEADRIVWLGAQARTHCSLDTLCQVVEALAVHAPEKLPNLVVLEDCHSNIPDVVLPDGTVAAPFRAWADAEYERLVRTHGIRLMRSTDPALHRFMTGLDF